MIRIANIPLCVGSTYNRYDNLKNISNRNRAFYYRFHYRYNWLLKLRKRDKRQIIAFSYRIASLIDIHCQNGDDRCVTIIGDWKYEIL